MHLEEAHAAMRQKYFDKKNKQLRRAQQAAQQAAAQQSAQQAAQIANIQ
jgi:hypothetical protein